jgi:NADPH2:quinone reductase
MRALRFHDWNAAPVLEDVPDPVVAGGEVLVKVQAAGLSHLDRTVATGTFGFRPQLPYVPGVEGSGTVIRGDGFAAGTQVLLRGGGLGLRRDGTWAEYVAAPAKAVSALPIPLQPEIAATFFQPTSTAAVALHDVARLTPGEHVVVVGATGAVGGQIVQQALRAGATVTGVVARQDHLPGVHPQAGAIALDDAEACAELAERRSVTLLCDTIGGVHLPERLGWVRPGGRAVLIGYVAGTTFEVDLPSWLLSDVALLPVNMIRQEGRARELSAGLAASLAAGELTLPVQTFQAEAVQDGLDQMAAGELIGRAALVW